MKFPRLVAMVYLQSWKIEESGHIGGPYLFHFDIANPRPSINSATRELVVEKEVGEEIDWTDRPLRERMLFKEIIEGPHSIGVSVAPTSSTFAAGLTDLIGRLGSEFVSNFLNMRFYTLNRMVEVAQDAGVGNIEQSLQKCIAAGSEDLAPLEPVEKELKIPLVTPNALRNPRPERHRVGEEYEDFLKESGDKNGYISLKIKLTER
ncbi:MAG: hypothetical protein ACQEP7_06050 [bacterium]